MFSFRTTPIDKQTDNLFVKGGRIGALCNQTAWHPEYGEYLFEFLSKRYNLIRLFTPCEGFSLLPDLTAPARTAPAGSPAPAAFPTQAGSPASASSPALASSPAPAGSSRAAGSASLPNKYREEEEILLTLSGRELEVHRLSDAGEGCWEDYSAELQDLDGLVIELQETGSRYCTYTSLIYNLFRYLKEQEMNLSIFLLDRVNPAGRQVEGTLMRAGYRSEIGLEGLPHRHGLTIGELALYLYEELHARFPLHIISYRAQDVNRHLMPWSIPPAAAYCGLFTPYFYSGQALWCGTNVSPGIGTARPFEQFGAPFLKSLADYNTRHSLESWNAPDNPLYDPSLYLRRTAFVPAFGEYAGELCYGFQLLPNVNMQYHALNHNLKIMRFIAENSTDFAMDSLPLYLGDRELMDFVRGENSPDDLREHIKVEEQKWIKKAKRALLYPEEQLFRIK